MPVLGLAGCHWRKTGKLQVRFHRNIAASSLAADCNVPQRPPAKLEVLHLSRWFTHTHPPAGGWEIKVPTMRWKWRLKGNENEVKMTMRWKLLNQDAKRGTQKKRERANTNTWNLAQNGQPWKGQGKEKKSGGRRKTEQDQRRRGKTEAPEPTWHGANLQQPQHATGQTYLERGERKNTWNRDPWGTS